jgi:hypothetical protein
MFQDSSYHNAFHYACEGGNLHIVDYFMDKFKEEKYNDENKEKECFVQKDGVSETNPKELRKRSTKDSVDKLGLRKHFTGEDVYVAIVVSFKIII